jgi:hypothetical protein
MVLVSNFDYFFAGNCHIISVTYTLEFRVIPSGMSFDLVVSLPITIGTIPLQEYIGTLAPPVYKAGFAPTALPPALDQFNMYPNLPSPTYAQSVWGVANVRSDDEHLGGDFEFLPKYAIYNTNY